MPLGHVVGADATTQPLEPVEHETYWVWLVQVLPEVAPPQAAGGVGQEQAAAPGAPEQVPTLQFCAALATTQPFASVEQVTYCSCELHTLPLEAPWHAEGGAGHPAQAFPEHPSGH